MEYADDNRKRISNAELRSKEMICSDQYSDLRRSAECHRQVRKFAQANIKPGRKLIDIVEEIETLNRSLIESNKILSGQAFPTGISVNHCAAHFTPNPGDTKVLDKNDVVKVCHFL
jgi:methionyl aminopeptidase